MTHRIITDLQMPGLSGLDLQDRLIARGLIASRLFSSPAIPMKTRAHAP